MIHRIRLLRAVLLVSCFILHPSSLVRADGGALRLCERAGPYQVAVFTSPTPVRSGPLDMSVLVQDAATGEIVPEAHVRLQLTARESGQSVDEYASAEAATNKLFRAALVQLPAPGWWDVEIAVDGPQGPAVVRFPMEAEEAPPPWSDLWPWFTWPALAVVLFAMHQVLVRRRLNPSAGPAPAPGSSTECCASR
jgi:hypothetical protein